MPFSEIHLTSIGSFYILFDVDCDALDLDSKTNVIACTFLTKLDPQIAIRKI